MLQEAIEEEEVSVLINDANVHMTTGGGKGMTRLIEPEQVDCFLFY